MTIRAGQIYRSADPRGGATIRISSYTPGHPRAHVIDAATSKRYRQILVTYLHTSATTKNGEPRRTGYVLVQGTEETER